MLLALGLLSQTVCGCPSKVTERPWHEVLCKGLSSFPKDNFLGKILLLYLNWPGVKQRPCSPHAAPIPKTPRPQPPGPPLPCQPWLPPDPVSLLPEADPDPSNPFHLPGSSRLRPLPSHLTHSSRREESIEQTHAVPNPFTWKQPVLRSGKCHRRPLSLHLRTEGWKEGQVDKSYTEITLQSYEKRRTPAIVVFKYHISFSLNSTEEKGTCRSC